MKPDVDCNFEKNTSFLQNYFIKNNGKEVSYQYLEDLYLIIKDV